MRHKFQTSYADVLIIPMSMEDSEKYRLLRNKPETMSWFESQRKISAAEQKIWYERYLENPAEIMFSVYSGGGVFLGGNSLYRINNVQGTAEYGRIIIARRYSGNGYGFKATMAAMKIAKEQLKLKELLLEVYQDNYPAIVSYDKAGFVNIGNKKDCSGREMNLMRVIL